MTVFHSIKVSVPTPSPSPDTEADETDIEEDDDEVVEEDEEEEVNDEEDEEDEAEEEEAAAVKEPDVYEYTPIDSGPYQASDYLDYYEKGRNPTTLPPLTKGDGSEYPNPPPPINHSHLSVTLVCTNPFKQCILTLLPEMKPQISDQLLQLCFIHTHTRSWIFADMYTSVCVWL